MPSAKRTAWGIQPLAWKDVLKHGVYYLAAVASALVLVNSYLNVSFMAKFPMTESVSGQMAHEFAVRAKLDWFESVVAAGVVTFCTSRLWSEFARRRRIAQPHGEDSG
jgi:hypothetical protein